MLGPIAGWVFGSEGSWSEGFQVIPRSARRAFGHGPLEGRQHHVVDMLTTVTSVLSIGFEGKHPADTTHSDLILQGVRRVEGSRRFLFSETSIMHGYTNYLAILTDKPWDSRSYLKRVV